MAFLDYKQFEGIVGIDQARILTKTPGSFAAAAGAAAAFITQITGVTEPADAASSPVWAQNACANLIYVERVRKQSGISDATRLAADALEKSVLATLEHYKTGAPDGATGPQTGEIEGMASW